MCGVELKLLHAERAVSAGLVREGLSEQIVEFFEDLGAFGEEGDEVGDGGEGAADVLYFYGTEIFGDILDAVAGEAIEVAVVTRHRVIVEKEWCVEVAISAGFEDAIYLAHSLRRFFHVLKYGDANDRVYAVVPKWKIVDVPNDIRRVVGDLVEYFVFYVRKILVQPVVFFVAVVLARIDTKTAADIDDARFLAEDAREFFFGEYVPGVEFHKRLYGSARGVCPQ